MRTKLLKIMIHIVIAIVFWGIWLPFSVSHKSVELPVIGMVSTCVYVLYYLPVICKYIQSKINF
ncbi:MAG: hypothetical protein J6D40_17915 [Butyricimonas sp.]|nr:hypothetical protein [Butyricimonas sp.]